MAATRRIGPGVVSFRAGLRAEPHGVDFLAAMREFERSAKAKPRIGESSVLSEEIVTLAQPPFLEFPASNIAGYKERQNAPPLIEARFLGFFGPQGALPLTTTIEAYQWSTSLDNDTSFSDFTNIFASRFLQLFFRAWANARPIAQHDRPSNDRFMAYLGSLNGAGSEAFIGRDRLDDIAKIAFAGLTGSKIKSASRLRRLIRGVFKVDVGIEERIGTWLSFDPGDHMGLGTTGSSLGENTFLGGRVFSINDKFRIRIDARDLDQYLKFLPTGELSDTLTDLVFFYVGHRFEFDVELSIPARYAPPARLGVSGQLGWTAWMAPATDMDEQVRLRDARFDPMERRRAASTASQSRARAGSRGRSNE